MCSELSLLNKEGNWQKSKNRPSSLLAGHLLHHLGRKRVQDGVMLLARGLVQCRDEFAQSWGHDDEVPRRACSFIIRVRHSCWHKYGCPCGCLDSSVTKPEREGPLQDVPRLVIGMVNVEVVWTASAPLRKSKGLSSNSNGELVLCSRLLLWDDNGLGHSVSLPPLRRVMTLFF